MAGTPIRRCSACLRGWCWPRWPSGGRTGLPARLWSLGLTLAAFLVAVSPLIWHPRYYAHGGWFPVSEVLLAVAGVLAGGAALVGLARARDPTGRTGVFWIALVLGCAAGAAMVRAAPDPHIDVFYLLQGSTKGLVQGKDMYQQKWAASPQVYHSHGLFAVYPYLPWTSVLLAPFRLVLGDVRYGEIAALAVAAITLRSFAGEQVRRSAVLGLLPLLVALHPKVTYADQQAWTEPLLVALLAADDLGGAAGSIVAGGRMPGAGAGQQAAHRPAAADRRSVAGLRAAPHAHVGRHRAGGGEPVDHRRAVRLLARRGGREPRLQGAAVRPGPAGAGRPARAHGGVRADRAGLAGRVPAGDAAGAPASSRQRLSRPAARWSCSRWTSPTSSPSSTTTRSRPA